MHDSINVVMLLLFSNPRKRGCIFFVFVYESVFGDLVLFFFNNKKKYIYIIVQVQIFVLFVRISASRMLILMMLDFLFHFGALLHSFS